MDIFRTAIKNCAFEERPYKLKILIKYIESLQNGLKWIQMKEHSIYFGLIRFKT